MSCDVKPCFEFKTEGREVWRKSDSYNYHWTHHNSIIEGQNIYSLELIYSLGSPVWVCLLLAKMLLLLLSGNVLVFLPMGHANVRKM